MFKKRKARKQEQFERAVITTTYDVLKDVFNQTSFDFAKSRISGLARQRSGLDRQRKVYISNDLADAIIKVVTSSNWLRIALETQRSILEDTVDEKIEAAFRDRLLWKADDNG